MTGITSFYVVSPIDENSNTRFARAQRTSWNFITLCERGYYDNTIFHRLIPSFMIQGGDPTSTGTGGDSAFGGSFRDEFDSRLVHDRRGILSMANSGPNTNKSQFFITFAPASHLDLVHCVFGRVVGGNATLDRMEAIEADKNAVPVKEIMITGIHVMVNPIAEADELLIEQIYSARTAKKAAEVKTILPKNEQPRIVGGPSATRELLPAANARYDAVRMASAKTESNPGSILGIRAPVVTSQSQVDKVAAFMRSQGGGEISGNVVKKRKVGGDFSSW